MSFPKPALSTTCVITGASSGIGEAMARDLARRGYGLTLVARREQLLVALAAELQREHGVRVTVIPSDISTSEGREKVFREVSEDGRDPIALVNNAGFARSGDFGEVNEDALLDMIDTNVRALVSLTRKFVPLLVGRGEGAILNVASTAAFQPMPHEATYAASKAFVLHFTDALGRELAGTGVTCTTLCPGPTDTGFATVAGLQAELDALPRFIISDPTKVAMSGVKAMISGRRVRTYGAFNRVGAVAGSHSPRPLSLRTVDMLWRNATAQ